MLFAQNAQLFHETARLSGETVGIAVQYTILFCIMLIRRINIIHNNIVQCSTINLSQCHVQSVRLSVHVCKLENSQR